MAHGIAGRAGARLGVVAVGLIVLTGCAGGAPGPSVPEPASPTVHVAPACRMQPLPTISGAPVSHAVVDFVDFIRWGGREYLTSASVSPPSEEDLGPAVGVSRCSFRELNDSTGRMPPAPVDGDTGFLPAGTEFFTVSGWAPECRIAARHDGRLWAYLAQDPTADHATPVPCAR